VEVVRGQPGQRAQPVPRVQPRNILPANDAVVNDMARQVLAVLPHVPRNVIVADLQQTGSVQQTINNFLDFTIPQVPVVQYPEQNESTLRHRQPWSTQNESNNEPSDLLTEQASNVASSESTDVQSDMQLSDPNETLITDEENSEINEPPARVTAQLRLPKSEEGQDAERQEDMPDLTNVTRTNNESSSDTRNAEQRQKRQLALQAAEKRLQEQQQQ
jgi:hypothetical protein